METVPLATLTTNTYQPSLDQVWLLETVFGQPTCRPTPSWAAAPGWWAGGLILFLIIIFIILALVSNCYGSHYGLIGAFIVLILLFFLFWIAGAALVNQWRQPRCQE